MGTIDLKTALRPVRLSQWLKIKYLFNAFRWKKGAFRKAIQPIMTLKTNGIKACHWRKVQNKTNRNKEAFDISKYCILICHWHFTLD